MATKIKTTRTPAALPRSRKSEGNAQYERFREAARELGVDDSPETFDREFRKIVPPKSS